MSDTLKVNPCPKCGAPIPAEAPQGLCPKCVLLGAAAATESGFPATATSEIPSRERVAVAFPQLEILELLGRGGMGFVFKARQPHLDRFVALKLLPDKLARDPRFAERFNREGRVLARLNHPNIVNVYDFGKTEHFYFLLMEFVDGVNLRQAMNAGRFSPGEALAVVPKICEALQYAHGQGVLHRDIKPENILLDARGQVKIADFGIAKLVGDEKPDVALTATGAALGTLHYMAPEQLEKPTEVDHRADIYSLGVVFYEMLTGELPIGRFAAPSSKTPVGTAVDEVVFRTLEKDRERRYQSAGEVKSQVEHLTGAGAGASAATPPKLPGASPVVPTWSQKAVWGAVLTGLSLPSPFLFGIVAYFTAGEPGRYELLFVAGAICLPGLVGCILGWMGLSDIRSHQGRLRGLPLAVFAALAWPLLALVAATLVIPWVMVHRSSAAAAPGVVMRFVTIFLLLAPAGAITFAVWSVYAASRWGGNKPAPRQRGVLKWVFIVLLVCGAAAVVLPALREARQQSSAGSFARLPDGMVELMALSRHPSDGLWWRPDGAASSEGPFENLGATSRAGPNERAIEFVFRTRGLRPEFSTPNYALEGALGWAGGGLPTRNGKPVPDGVVIAATFPAALRKTTLRVGVAIDPWETVARDSVAAEQLLLHTRGAAAQVAFLGAVEEKSGNTVLTVGHNFEGDNVRAVAVDVEGHEHTSLLSSSTREHLSATFVKLPRERIREFRFQVRPYRWAEFKNVHLQPSEAGAPGEVSHSVSDSKLVIDVWPGAYPEVTPQPDKLRWSFKCLLPPQHLAQILFVRWTNGVPTILEGQSGYYKVGATPVEVDLSLSYDKHDASQPAHQRSQWNVSLGLGYNKSSLMPEEPAYRPLDTPGRMTVQSGHQRSVPLVEFADQQGARRRNQTGIDLRILLLPLKSPAIRSVPTERDHGNYISGSGLVGVLEEALQSLKKLPVDP